MMNTQELIVVSLVCLAWAIVTPAWAATVTVKQSGGDYSTLQAAIAGSVVAGDTISIEGTWTVDDTTACNTEDDNVTIIADSSSKHPGYYDTTTNHYRLVVNTANVFIVDMDTWNINGIAIHQTGTGSNRRCISGLGAADTLNVSDCILYGAGAYSGHMGIATFDAYVLNVTNCVFINNGGSGIYMYGDSTENITLNANSCTLYMNGTYVTASTSNSGIGIWDAGTGTYDINVFNCVSVENDTQGGSDYRTLNGTATWDIHNSIDSDNSIATEDAGNVECLASRTSTDTASPGAGDWVIFQEDDTVPYDLRLQDNATDNDAQDHNSTSTGAGLSMPATDIVGTSRPQTASYDRGAFEVVAAAAGTILPFIMQNEGVQ